MPHRNYGGTSSALMRQLDNQRLNVAVQRLYGCTSILVVSQQGIWLPHFWEAPSFLNQATFQNDVLNQMEFGDGTNLMPGISQFRARGAQFDIAENPRTLVFTPRDRHNPDTQGAYLYNNMIWQIQTKLKQIFYDVNVEPAIIDYVPVGPDYMMNSDQLFHDTTAKGKIVIQYDPSEATLPISPINPCPLQQAMLKVWVEDRPSPIYEDTWIAESNQILLASGNQKRADACSRSMSSDEPSSISKSAPSTTTLVESATPPQPDPPLRLGSCRGDRDCPSGCTCKGAWIGQSLGWVAPPTLFLVLLTDFSHRACLCA